MRKKRDLYPDLRAFIDVIEKEGISVELLQKIIQRHSYNSKYNKKLYERYRTEDVPIRNRKPRFEEEKPINNKLNNDFFGEIIDFKTGYFAGTPIKYGYSTGEEAEEDTGGNEAVETATRTVTDFVTRNNMFGVDMETTKFASIYGYAGRLFYIDPDGNERVMPVHGYETIILSKTSMCEPQYAIRYFETVDIDNNKEWVVEFYDDTDIYTYKGLLSSLELISQEPHLFDYCPLQGIENNKELLGDAEKVLSLIDDYDKVLSDNSNEIEAFVHAYLIFENLRINDEEIQKGQKSGSYRFNSTGTQQGKAYFLTKDINDAFTEHHMERTENNIYRFSKTPNLTDESFGTASGVSLRFKLHGLETKCGMFEAKMIDAAQYMWRVLASAWRKKTVEVDPIHVTMEFSRNFPQDELQEAQTVQALKAAGVPDKVAYSRFSWVDDVNAVMEEKEAEQDITSLYEDDSMRPEVGVNEKNMYKVTSVLGQLKRGQITKSVAIRILTGIGFSEANAETIVSENAEEAKEDKKQKKDKKKKEAVI